VNWTRDGILLHPSFDGTGSWSVEKVEQVLSPRGDLVYRSYSYIVILIQQTGGGDTLVSDLWRR